MTKDAILEAYRKLKLEEELNRELKECSKYKTIRITYEQSRGVYSSLEVDSNRLKEFIISELHEIQKRLDNKKAMEAK